MSPGRRARSRVEPRYCGRELEDGTTCSHHLVVHPGEGPCTGMGPYGDPCLCRGFVEREKVAAETVPA